MNEINRGQTRHLWLTADGATALLPRSRRWVLLLWSSVSRLASVAAANVTVDVAAAVAVVAMVVTDVPSVTDVIATAITVTTAIVMTCVPRDIRVAATATAIASATGSCCRCHHRHHPLLCDRAQVGVVVNLPRAAEWL